MDQVFVVGAGFSAAAGYPVTSGLAHAIAHYLVGYKERHGRVSRLQNYLTAVYGLKSQAIEDGSAIWNEFLATRDNEVLKTPSKLPNVIELLTVLDFSIQSGFSFGPDGDDDELEGRELSRIRDGVLRAFVRCFDDIRQRGGVKNAAIRRFAEIVRERDATVVTTNWDMVLDDCLKTKDSLPDYGVRSAILTDGLGERLKHKRKGRLLKLHGAVNWLHCPRCGDLWINTDIATAKGAEDDYESWFDRESRCGAQMDGLMISPSFVRSAANLNLQNIATKAQRALAQSNHWVFIGYSLPDDDYWIRAMLLRARTIQRGKSEELKVTVVYKSKAPKGEDALRARYCAFFADLKPTFKPDGVKSYLKTLA